MENIVLIGMPGAGKSTVGVPLAEALGLPFLDIDRAIEAQEGRPLQELVDELGVSKFLDFEADFICALTCTGCVISTGGSAVCRPAGLKKLKKLGHVLYLRLPLPALERRIANLHSRGIAMAPGQTLGDLFALRAPLYEACADATVDVDRQTLAESVAAALAACRKDA